MLEILEREDTAIGDLATLADQLVYLVESGQIPFHQDVNDFIDDVDMALNEAEWLYWCWSIDYDDELDNPDLVPV